VLQIHGQWFGGAAFREVKAAFAGGGPKAPAWVVQERHSVSDVWVQSTLYKVDAQVGFSHVMQVSEPFSEEYFPATQLVQFAIVVAPRAAEAVPARQSVHDVAADTPTLYFPAVHCEHTPSVVDEGTVDRNRPAGQVVTACGMGAPLPAEQRWLGVQAVQLPIEDPEQLDLKVPAEQTGQDVQFSANAAPTTVEYFPASHGVQLEDEFPPLVIR